MTEPPALPRHHSQTQHNPLAQREPHASASSPTPCSVGGGGGPCGLHSLWPLYALSTCSHCELIFGWPSHPLSSSRPWPVGPEAARPCGQSWASGEQPCVRLTGCCGQAPHSRGCGWPEALPWGRQPEHWHPEPGACGQSEEARCLDTWRRMTAIRSLRAWASRWGQEGQPKASSPSAGARVRVRTPLGSAGTRPGPHGAQGSSRARGGGG